VSQRPTEDVQITLARGGLADLHRIVAEIGADRRIAHTARTITSERRRKGNQRKAGEGENPAGKRETGGKPAGEPEDVR